MLKIFTRLHKNSYYSLLKIGSKLVSHDYCRQENSVIMHARVIDPEYRQMAKTSSIQYFMERFPNYLDNCEKDQLECEFVAIRSLSRNDYEQIHGLDVDIQWIKLSRQFPLMYKLA